MRERAEDQQNKKPVGMGWNFGDLSVVPRFSTTQVTLKGYKYCAPDEDCVCPEVYSGWSRETAEVLHPVGVKIAVRGCPLPMAGCTACSRLSKDCFRPKT